MSMTAFFNRACVRRERRDRGACFDKLSMTKAYVTLSLSKGAPR